LALVFLGFMKASSAQVPIELVKLRCPTQEEIAASGNDYGRLVYNMAHDLLRKSGRVGVIATSENRESLARFLRESLGDGGAFVFGWDTVQYDRTQLLVLRTSGNVAPAALTNQSAYVLVYGNCPCPEYGSSCKPVSSSSYPVIPSVCCTAPANGVLYPETVVVNPSYQTPSVPFGIECERRIRRGRKVCCKVEKCEDSSSSSECRESSSSSSSSEECVASYPRKHKKECRGHRRHHGHRTRVVDVTEHGKVYKFFFSRQHGRRGETLVKVCTKKSRKEI